MFLSSLDLYRACEAITEIRDFDDISSLTRAVTLARMALAKIKDESQKAIAAEDLKPGQWTGHDRITPVAMPIAVRNLKCGQWAIVMRVPRPFLWIAVGDPCTRGDDGSLLTFSQEGVRVWTGGGDFDEIEIALAPVGWEMTIRQSI